jgi:hypothetical protein
MVTGSYKRQTTTYRVLRRVACGAQLDEQTRLREVFRKETPLTSEGSKMPRNPLFAALTDTPRIIHTHARANRNRSGNTSFSPEGEVVSIDPWGAVATLRSAHATRPALFWPQRQTHPSATKHPKCDVRTDARSINQGRSSETGPNPRSTSKREKSPTHSRWCHDMPTLS